MVLLTGRLRAPRTQEGEFFGYNSFMLPDSKKYSIECLSTSQLIYIDYQHFLKNLSLFPKDYVSRTRLQAPSPATDLSTSLPRGRAWVCTRVRVWALMCVCQSRPGSRLRVPACLTAASRFPAAHRRSSAT